VVQHGGSGRNIRHHCWPDDASDDAGGIDQELSLELAWIAGRPFRQESLADGTEADREILRMQDPREGRPSDPESRIGYPLRIVVKRQGQVEVMGKRAGLVERATANDRDIDSGGSEFCGVVLEILRMQAAVWATVVAEEDDRQSAWCVLPERGKVDGLPIEVKDGNVRCLISHLGSERRLGLRCGHE